MRDFVYAQFELAASEITNRLFQDVLESDLDIVVHLSIKALLMMKMISVFLFLGNEPKHKYPKRCVYSFFFARGYFINPISNLTLDVLP